MAEWAEFNLDEGEWRIPAERMKARVQDIVPLSAQHLPERRKMMQAWADYLEGLRAGAKVVPIKRRA